MLRSSARAACAALAASTAVACASDPPSPEPASCPAPGPRTADARPFAIVGNAERGSRLFLEECEGCHAHAPAMRLPDAPADAPRLDCAEWIGSVDDAYLYDAINRGPGIDGHGEGPPLGERLAPMDVADLVAHLRSLAEE